MAEIILHVVGWGLSIIIGLLVLFAMYIIRTLLIALEKKYGPSHLTLSRKAEVSMVGFIALCLTLFFWFGAVEDYINETTVWSSDRTGPTNLIIEQNIHGHWSVVGVVDRKYFEYGEYLFPPRKLFNVPGSLSCEEISLKATLYGENSLPKLNNARTIYTVSSGHFKPEFQINDSEAFLKWVFQNTWGKGFNGFDEIKEEVCGLVTSDVEEILRAADTLEAFEAMQDGLCERLLGRFDTYAYTNQNFIACPAAG